MGYLLYLVLLPFPINDVPLYRYLWQNKIIGYENYSDIP